MERIKYDFSEFRKIMFALKSDQSPMRLNQLKVELNEFFRDSKCKDVIYTNNTDKLFFGMCVMPIVDGNTAVSILQSDKSERFNAYYLELDSKLFSPLLNLTADELVAILLHEVGHVINTPQPVEEVRNAIDVYLAKNKESLVISDSIHYREILAYGIKNSIRKLTSLFEYGNEEIIADEFVVMCGYGPQLESAYSKIVKNTGRINRDVSNKFIVLQWTLRLYKNVKFERIGALKMLNKGKSITASKLEIREMENVIRRLNKIDDDALLEAAVLEFKGVNEIVRGMKVKGMRNLADELYEYNMRIRNIDDEDTAMLLLRQINLRISIIDDYIATEKLSQDEIERWSTLRDKYNLLREDLGKKKLYNKKFYGLWVEYPEQNY